MQTVCQDLGDWDKTREAIDALPVMDCLVNNAAMGESQPFLQVTEERLDRLIQFEFFGLSLLVSIAIIVIFVYCNNAK